MAARAASKPTKVLLDTNVLLDVLFDRPHRSAVEAAVSQLVRNADVQLAISVLSVSTVFYFVEKGGFAKTAAHAFLSNYRIFDMNEADYSWAMDNDQGDFEDALQVACAMRHGCRDFLTLDKALAERHRKHIATRLVH